MLALSIFCSSQTISVALYSHGVLTKFYEKEIVDGRIEGIFTLIEKCKEGNSFNNLEKIFFANGPGSFTALRSIKSICQGLALYSGAKDFSIPTFVPYLINDLEKPAEILLSYKFSAERYFYQLFQIKNKLIEKKTIVAVEEISTIYSFFKKYKKKNKNLYLITDDKKIKNFFKGATKFYKVTAKDLAKSFFNGFGDERLEIFYHNAYYD